ncbi:MAG TPA: hypothetical protein VNO52_03290 [Methylomirabilota bacterium]|nr:hypothetical protein [Methylomirabilota bacterium]
MRMVTAATFNEPEDAEPLRTRLEAAGIRAEVQDERKRQKYWFLSEPLAGVHLRVDHDRFESASRLLSEWDATEHVLHAAIHCPACDSSRVEFPQFTRKFVSPGLYAVLCALHLFERKFYCQDCHYTWPVSEKLPRRTDILGWPVKERPAGVANPKP